ncbi:hypothetical protein HA402_014970 [Bradysia odoriphaga]|nr:hypothetical protein HA402_014970 [Bradysia odoriphaga]
MRPLSGLNSDLSDDDGLMDIENFIPSRTSIIFDKRLRNVQVQDCFEETNSCQMKRKQKNSRTVSKVPSSLKADIFRSKIGAISVDQTTDRQTICTSPIKSESIQIDDWLLVKFFRSSNEPGTSESFVRIYIGQVTDILPDESFMGQFLGANVSLQHSGSVHRWSDDVEHVSTFTHFQIVVRLRPPYRYNSNGLLRFEIGENL